MGLFVRVSPPDLPRVDQVSIDTTVLLFVTAIAVLTGIGFGIAPALQVSGSNLIDATKESRLRAIADARCSSLRRSRCR